MYLCTHIDAIVIPSASAGVVLSSDAGPEVCSGTTVTFTCRASAGIVRWRYDGSAPIAVVEGNAATTLGPFEVAVIDAESNTTFVTTTATAPITSELSGTNITCEDFPLTDVQVATLPDITGNFRICSYVCLRSVPIKPYNCCLAEFPGFRLYCNIWHVCAVPYTKSTDSDTTINVWVCFI